MLLKLYTPNTREIKPNTREILANLNLDNKTNEINQPIDEMTLFITFSKGYSIFKNELRVFFFFFWVQT
jgi:hypothetical protein